MPRRLGKTPESWLARARSRPEWGFSLRDFEPVKLNMAAKEPDTPACYLTDEETTAVIAKIWSLVVSGPSAQDLILSSGDHQTQSQGDALRGIEVSETRGFRGSRSSANVYR